MKKKIFICLAVIFIISTYSIYPQSGWFTQQGTLPVKPFDIFFIDSQTGWISADSGRVLKTINGGTNWTMFSTTTTYNLHSIRFINSLTGWAAGGQGYNNPFSYDYSVIVKTVNGGINWVTQYSYSAGHTFNTLAIANENNIFATSYGTDESGYATDGYMFMTSNSGINWVNTIISGPGFTNVFFLNSQTGWSLAYSQMDIPPTMRMIYKTTNTGINWTRIYKDTLFAFTPLLNKIQMIDSNLGFLRTNILKKTTNSGINWNNTDSISTSGLSDMFFISKDTGWVCKNPIKNTTNGGLNWTSQNIPYNVNKLFFINNKTGWAIGNYPVVLLKTTTGGVTNVKNISNNVPKKYFLYQNYPNPFNPSTIIKFQIKDSKIVTLKVYDVLGKEIATLVNEKLSPGTYEVPFSIDQFSNNQIPSGVYFYKILTNEFSETKKLTLIK